MVRVWGWVAEFTLHHSISLWKKCHSETLLWLPRTPKFNWHCISEIHEWINKTKQCKEQMTKWKKKTKIHLLKEFIHESFVHPHGHFIFLLCRLLPLWTTTTTTQTFMLKWISLKWRGNSSKLFNCASKGEKEKLENESHIPAIKSSETRSIKSSQVMN